MATTEFTTPAVAGGSFLRLAGAGIARLAVLWRAYRNRREVARLLSLDSRMLSDIGITRGDVESAMAIPMPDDPSSHLAAMAHERRAAQRAGYEARRARATWRG